jgi:hypothetical protein
MDPDAAQAVHDVEGILTLYGRDIMMSFVRTTLTLDPDVARMLDDEVHRTRRPFKQIVNDALRRGLAPRVADETLEPYRVTVHKAKLRAGIDPTSLNRLADELDDEATVDKLSGKRGPPKRR